MSPPKLFLVVVITLVSICLPSQPLVVRASSFSSPLQQTTAPFLLSPYYGTTTINSYFDHRYPTYTVYPNSTYTNVIKYDGEEKPGCTQQGQTNCIWYDGHDGYDFALSYQPVLAAAGGTVKTVGWAIAGCHNGPTCSYGLRVEIDHGNGYSTRYGHLSAIAVELDQTVIAGQIIGTSGSTGYSTGPHLHFGVFQTISRYAVDPFGWSGAGTDPWQVYSGVTSSWLWVDGQWMTPPTPILAPDSGATVMIDDGDAGFELRNSSGVCGYCLYWWYVTGVGTNGDMYYTYVNTVVDYEARWQPSFPFAGYYEVQVFIPANYATSWQANYWVWHKDGVRITIVDQLGTSNLWLSLGTYRFDAGSNLTLGRINVSDYTQDTDRASKVGVDAVRFIARSRVPLPLIEKP